MAEASQVPLAAGRNSKKLSKLLCSHSLHRRQKAEYQPDTASAELEHGVQPEPGGGDVSSYLTVETWQRCLTTEGGVSNADFSLGSAMGSLSRP